MSDRDYYEVLGLTPRADGTMVDQAYWHLARKYQSLATTNARGRRLLDDLNEAYGVLGNARLRREYDAFRDNVLVAGGVIGPVRSRPKEKSGAESNAAAGGARRLPKLLLPAAWRTYLAAALIAAAGTAGAAITGRVEISMLGVAVALVVGAIPLVRRHVNITMPSIPSMPALPSVTMPSVNMPSVSMPSAPQMSMPDVKTPKINLAQVGERFGRTAQEDAIDPDELHASTAAVIARWRKRMGLATPLPGAEPAEPIPLMPSNALVEIVESERQIDDGDSAPLLAVIDILRGAHKPEGAGTWGEHGAD